MLACLSVCLGDSANSRNSTAAAIDLPVTSVFSTPESVMPLEGDAATISPQRDIAMPSPAWSRRSRRRDLVSLDQDKKSVEVTLSPIVHKKFEVPLDNLPARSSTTVPLDLLSSRSAVPLDFLFKK